MSKKPSDRYIRMWGPVVDVLRTLGGSGTPKEVIPLVIKHLDLPDTEIEQVLKSGAPRVANEIYWASHYLKLAGFISKAEGVWILTELGRTKSPALDEARKIRSKLHADTRKSKTPAPDLELPEEESQELQSVEAQLHEQLLEMSPVGFERFCQLMLRKTGFEEVHVTGKSGDGGIDGYGTMRLSPFMSFHMIFQCKRYKGSVGPDIVRQMRGSLDGRTDKGLIITTGTFTRDAVKEATREGVKQVELVDGESLIELMKRYRLGAEPIEAFSVNYDFFKDYA